MCRRGLFAAILLLFSAAPALAAAPAPGCAAAAREAERQFRIPRGLLNAVATVESRMGGIANPYALNIAGQPLYPATASGALGAIQQAVAVGQTGVAIGCMQIRYDFHRQHFRGPSEMLEARANVRYAARFLRELHDWLGSWDKALSYYNTGQYAQHLPYLCKVAGHLDVAVGPDIMGAVWRECGLATLEDGMKRPRGPLLLLAADRGWDGLSVVEPRVPGERFAPLADVPEAKPIEGAGEAGRLSPAAPEAALPTVDPPKDAQAIGAPAGPVRVLGGGAARTATLQRNAPILLPAKSEGPARAARLAPPPPPERPVVEIATAPPGTPHFAHLASYGDRDSAVTGWRVLARRFPGVLGDLAPVVQDVQVAEGRTAYRLLVGAFPSRADADAFCRRFSDPAQYCQPRP